MRHWNLLTHKLDVHRPEVLQSDRGQGRSIAIVLPAGELLQEHVVHERAYLIVLSGKIQVQLGHTSNGHGDSSILATEGSLLIFDPKEPHEVRAVDESRLLLILAPWPGVGHPGTRDP